ncbi:hypothetical protein TNCV_4677311 [Trichonephila clavipes]|nr:hypothetical protein TNCV_4677311 [Trichonephila clavipes]
MEQCSVSLKNFGQVTFSYKMSRVEDPNVWWGKNPTLSTRELATRMKIDHTTILRHLSEIGKPQAYYLKKLPLIDFQFFKHLELFLRAKRFEKEDSLKNSEPEFIDS